MIASAAQISKKGYPADFRVKAVQMRDWEAMSRASLGILNHLDWFLSYVWTVLDGCPIEKDRQADGDVGIWHRSEPAGAYSDAQLGQQCDNASGGDPRVVGSL